MPTTFDFSGKTVLITGASYGLGAGFAEAYAKAGADLVLTARSADLLEATGKQCEALGSKVTCVVGDVSVEDDVKRVVATGIENHGAIDVLVNNAGISEIRGFGAEQFPTDAWQSILNVDLTGAFLYLREVGKHMLARGSGNIVNICSIMSDGASEFNIAAYAAAKGGLRNLTKQVGCEWADRGVRVNSLSPGFIVTEMTRPMLEGMGMTTWIATRTPMRRVGEMDEISGPLLFLTSDLASYVTGVDLLVDGGTNASNGTYQIAPIHHEWNTDAPMIGDRWAGVVARPDWYQMLEGGIPGLHYPIPENLGS